MNLIEIVDKRDLKLKSIEDLTSKLKLEKRKFNETENLEFISMKEEVEKLNKTIDEIKNADKKAVRNEVNTKNNKNNMTNFSLLKTIRDIAEGRSLSDETIQIMNAGKEEFVKAGLERRGQIILPFEYREGINAQTALEGHEIVATQVMPLLPSLKAKTVLGLAGANFYTNLVGDIQIPIYAGTSSAWASETGTTANGVGAFSDVTLTPHRLTTFIDISKQFLAQDAISAEATLMNDLIASIIVKVENTAFDAIVGTASRPAGLFYGADLTGSLSGTTTFAKVIGIKAAVDTANALTGNLAYVTNPAEGAVLETTSTDPNGGAVMIMNNGKVNGYPVYVTSNLGTSVFTGVTYNLVAFGNWADYLVGQWGGMDITVDPYTQAIYGKVRIVVNTFWDFKPRRAASFKLGRLN